METSTLVVCFKYHCRQQESDQLSVFTGFCKSVLDGCYEHSKHCTFTKI